MTARTLSPTNQFKRDAKKHLNILLSDEWTDALYHLRHDLSLPPKYQDHPLHGNWAGFRDCHIKPDLLLIYALIDDEIGQAVQLVRLGTHSELF